MHNENINYSFTNLYSLNCDQLILVSMGKSTGQPQTMTFDKLSIVLCLPTAGWTSLWFQRTDYHLPVYLLEILRTWRTHQLVLARRKPVLLRLCTFQQIVSRWLLYTFAVGWDLPLRLQVEASPLQGLVVLVGVVYKFLHEIVVIL